MIHIVHNTNTTYNINNIMLLHKPCYRPPRSESLPYEDEAVICLSGDATSEPFENSNEELTW